MKLKFVASGNYHTYEVVDYGGKYDERRVHIWTRAPPLVEPGGFKRFAYTEEEYQRQVLDLVGYLRFNWLPRPTQETMFEVARMLNAMARESWERAFEKYPDFVEPWSPLCKGICCWDSEAKDWVGVDLPEGEAGA